MRKVYFVLVLFCVSAFVYAQNKSVSFKNSIKAKEITPISLQNKAVIWSDDFSNPANWVISHEPGTTGDWVIGTNGPSGTYAIPKIQSTSGGNFALFDSDLICSGNQIANLTTANPIDLTGHPQVMLTFEQMYRRWFDSTFVFVSTNNGTTWTKFVVNGNFTNNQMTSNPNLVSINISNAIASNPANVKIRFQFYSPSSMGAYAGCGYAWMIDDVKIIDATANDVKINSVYADFVGTSYYEIIPLSQASTYEIGAVVENAGSATQTNVTLHVEDAQNNINETVSKPSLSSGAQDSLYVNLNLNNTTALDYGLKIYVTQNETDEIPQNNIGDSIYFSTDTKLYLRSTNLSVYLTQYSFGSSAPATTGMEYGANYAFLNNDRIDSIIVLIYGASGNGNLKGRLYNIDLQTGARTLVAETNPYTPTGTPEYKRLALTTPYQITSPSVLTATVQLNYSANTDTLKIGADGNFFGDESVACAAYLKVNNQWGWYYITNTVPIVGLIRSNQTSLLSSSLADKVFVYPNPASNTLYVMNEKANLVQIYNLTGQLVAEYHNQNTINISNLAQGTYMVKVVTNNVVFTQKINIVR